MMASTITASRNDSYQIGTTDFSSTSSTPWTTEEKLSIKTRQVTQLLNDHSLYAPYFDLFGSHCVIPLFDSTAVARDN
jgi:hypothetical protein